MRAVSKRFFIAEINATDSLVKKWKKINFISVIYYDDVEY